MEKKDYSEENTETEHSKYEETETAKPEYGRLRAEENETAETGELEADKAERVKKGLGKTEKAESEKVRKETAEYEKAGKEKAKYRKPEKETARYERQDKEKAKYEKREKEKLKYGKPEKERTKYGKPEKETIRNGKPEKEKARCEKPEKETVRYEEPEKEKARHEKPDKERDGYKKPGKEKDGYQSLEKGESGKVKERKEKRKDKEVNMEKSNREQNKQTIRQQLKYGSDWNIRPYLAMGLTFFIVFCCCILVVWVLFRSRDIKSMFGMLVSIAQPILYGLAIGYLINPIMMFFERGMLKLADRKGLRKKFRRVIRTVSSILAVLVFILFIATLVSMVIPEVSENLSHLVDTMPAQINSFIVHLNDWEFGNEKITAMLEEYVTTAADWMEDFLKNSVLPQTKDYVATVTSGLLNVLNAFKNIIIGLIVSIYVMCEKESFEGQTKKIIFALFPARAANQAIQVFHTTNAVFGGFIKGKLLDSLIIGIICYIVLCIIKMPYTLLVSVIVGVTNIIPFFGPFIGAIPSTFLILLVDPLYALYFVIFVVILQQVDGNIIGPKILGDSTGLSSFWVMFAILIGSGLFGVMGMLLGCPVFAVIYYIVQKVIHFFLEKKKLPVDTGVYIEATGVEPGGSQLWYGQYADDKNSKSYEK